VIGKAVSLSETIARIPGPLPKYDQRNDEEPEG
jgi:hypothetical protein